MMNKSNRRVEIRDFSKKSRYSFLKNAEEVWPLRARWFWLDSQCNLKEKVLEWKFPFNFSSYVQEFVDAGLSGDFSNLPSIIPNNSYSQLLSREEFLENDLGLSRLECHTVKSVKLEDLPNGWEFIVLERYGTDLNSSISTRWANFGMLEKK